MPLSPNHPRRQGTNQPKPNNPKPPPAWSGFGEKPKQNKTDQPHSRDPPTPVKIPRRLPEAPRPTYPCADAKRRPTTWTTGPKPNNPPAAVQTAPPPNRVSLRKNAPTHGSGTTKVHPEGAHRGHQQQQTQPQRQRARPSSPVLVVPCS